MGVPDGENSPAVTPGRHRYSVFACVFAALGGLYFGYDQGVTGGMLAMPSFINDFCVDDSLRNCTDDTLPDDFATFVTLYNVLYYMGCALGAILGGTVADKYGRRAAIFFAAFSFVTGTSWVISTPAGMYAVVLSGRVLEGVGVGASSFSAPLYNAEMAPKEYRGALAGFMQMTIVTGLLAASAVNIVVQDFDAGWRITNGVILLPPVVVMFGIFCFPESPRWLYQRKGKEPALAALKTLRCTDDVMDEFELIRQQVEEEVGKKKATYKDCFAPKVRKRTFTAMFLQVLQQATGINPIFTYGGIIFKAVTDNVFLSLFVLAGVNFLSTIPSLYWVDRYGRRYMFLLGAVGMTLGHLAAGTIFVTGCEDNGGDISCNENMGELMVAFAAVFIFFFAISWGPIAWIYPSEIFPLHVRAKAVSLSTLANWTMGALMIAIVKLFPLLTIAGVFFLFAVLCVACFIYVYYNCPETKGIALEAIEFLFSHPEKIHSGVYGTREASELAISAHEAAVKERAAEEAATINPIYEEAAFDDSSSGGEGGNVEHYDLNMNNLKI